MIKYEALTPESKALIYAMRDRTSVKAIMSKINRNYSFIYKATTEAGKTLANCFCTNHTGKMSGMISISTSPVANARCMARAKNPECICHYCYAMAMQDQYSDLAKKLIANTDFITSVMLTPDDIPIVNPVKFAGIRFESFGDLINEIQVYNYFMIAKVNAHMPCALWTKNPDIIASAMDKYGIEKPDNLTILYSSKTVNKPEAVTYDFIDKTFTVYDPEYIKANNVDINCGARDCTTCMRCYHRNTANAISEKLK